MPAPYLPSIPPYLTFFGPDANSQIHAVAPSIGQEVARFQINILDKKIFTISRILLSGSTTICTGRTSAGHGGLTTPNIHLDLHGQDMKISAIVGMPNLQVTIEGWEMHASMGKLRWKVDKKANDVFELVDAGKALLARADMGMKRLDVYVQGDEQFLDLVVCSCVGVLSYQQREEGMTGKGVKGSKRLPMAWRRDKHWRRLGLVRLCD